MVFPNSDKLLTFSLLGFVILCIALSFFVPPFADDFCHAHGMLEQGTWLAYLNENWSNLNGRWGTTSLRYGYDVINGPDNAYWLTTPLSILSIFSGFYLLAFSVLNSSKQRLTAAMLFTLLFLVFASKIASLLFWSTGMTDYTVGYGLIGVAFYLTLRAESWLLKALALPVIFLASGLSELMLVPLAILLMYRLVAMPKDVFTYALLLVFVIGAALNVFAPGNMARIGRVDQVFDVVQFIKETLLYGARGVVLPSIALYLVSHLRFIKEPLLELASQAMKLPPALARLLTTFAFSFPFLVIAVLELSLGAPGPGRAHNVSLFCLIALWPVAISQLQWLKPRDYQTSTPRVTLTALAFTVLLAVNVKNVAKDLFSGTAQEYSVVVNKARALLSSPESKNQHIIIRSVAKKPKVTMGGGHLITTNQESWLNRCVALYHGNASVVWQPSE